MRILLSYIYLLICCAITIPAAAADEYIVPQDYEMAFRQHEKIIRETIEDLGFTSGTVRMTDLSLSEMKAADYRDFANDEFKAMIKIDGDLTPELVKAFSSNHAHKDRDIYYGNCLVITAVSDDGEEMVFLVWDPVTLSSSSEIRTDEGRLISRIGEIYYPHDDKLTHKLNEFSSKYTYDDQAKYDFNRKKYLFNSPNPERAYTFVHNGERPLEVYHKTVFDRIDDIGFAPETVRIQTFGFIQGVTEDLTFSVDEFLSEINLGQNELFKVVDAFACEDIEWRTAAEFDGGFMVVTIESAGHRYALLFWDPIAWSVPSADLPEDSMILRKIVDVLPEQTAFPGLYRNNQNENSNVTANDYCLPQANDRAFIHHEKIIRETIEDLGFTSGTVRMADISFFAMKADGKREFTNDEFQAITKVEGDLVTELKSEFSTDAAKREVVFDGNCLVVTAVGSEGERCAFLVWDPFILNLPDMEQTREEDIIDRIGYIYYPMKGGKDLRTLFHLIDHAEYNIIQTDETPFIRNETTIRRAVEKLGFTSGTLRMAEINLHADNVERHLEYTHEEFRKIVEVDGELIEGLKEAFASDDGFRRSRFDGYCLIVTAIDEDGEKYVFLVWDYLLIHAIMSTSTESLSKAERVAEYYYPIDRESRYQARLRFEITASENAIFRENAYLINSPDPDNSYTFIHNKEWSLDKHHETIFNSIEELAFEPENVCLFYTDFYGAITGELTIPLKVFLSALDLDESQLPDLIASFASETVPPSRGHGYDPSYLIINIEHQGDRYALLMWYPFRRSDPGPDASEETQLFWKVSSLIEQYVHYEKGPLADTDQHSPLPPHQQSEQ